jgi:glyoxylase-like metal-dependent hydrolase (beta-lactamase superfamily II)
LWIPAKFDDLPSLFYQDVVSTYDEYVAARDGDTAGRCHQTRTALDAAAALFHFREHLPQRYKKTRAEVAADCPDYRLVADVTNATKHRVLDRDFEESGKNLTTIYSTHGHGDHFFGNGILLERFPGARAVATPKVIEIMRKQTSPQVMAGLWNKRFPGQIPKNIVFPDQLDGNTLSLEGHELIVVDVGHTDTDDSTCLYVPSIDLVVAGDLTYNDVHQYFAETLTHDKRMEWVAALDKIEALKPSAVIAGHKRETRTQHHQ